MKIIPKFGDNREAIQGQPRLTSDEAWAQVERHLGVVFSSRKPSLRGQQKQADGSSAAASRSVPKVSV